jgi:aminoglycoside phosphotransferase (APT) family kinase protein
MVNPDNNILQSETVQALLDKLFPGSQPIDIHLAPGSYSNFTHLVTVRGSDNAEFRIVVRRYQAFGHYDRGQKARREFAALQSACENGIPAPQPLYLDDSGDLLGVPGIATRYVPGAQIESPAEPLTWARAMAETLAKIHAVPPDFIPRDLLLDANTEATWFLHSGHIPDFMQDHPDGERVWQAVQAGFPRLEPVPPTLVHVDYWPGNILWDGDHISAVVDWEEAALGDPAIDVAYCCMDIALKDLPVAADEFLRAYEIAVGHPLANLGFWELAASARPMLSPQGWVDQSPQKELFSRFIAQAMQKCV